MVSRVALERLATESAEADKAVRARTTYRPFYHFFFADSLSLVAFHWQC